MKINLNNYEEWMIDYIEGNLSEVQKKELMEFLEFHPELKNDLELFGQTRITPDKNIVFGDKEILKRTVETKVVGMRNWVKYSAAIAAALLLFVGINYFNGSSDKPVAIKKYEYQQSDDNFAFDRKTDSTNENLKTNNREEKEVEKAYAQENESDKNKINNKQNINKNDITDKQEKLKLQREKLDRIDPVEFAHTDNISSDSQLEKKDIKQIENKAVERNDLASTNKKDKDYTNISFNDNTSVVDWWNDAVAIGGEMENVVSGILEYDIDPFKKQTGGEEVLKTRSVNIFGLSYYSRKKTNN
ncbi:MAG: hypothetical protein ACHQFW_01305 [Chitinophagales bacterium]